MLLKPDGIYPSARHHTRDGNYTTAASGGGVGSLLTSSRQQPPTANLFVADYYAGYTSVDCPSTSGSAVTGSYPVTSGAVLSMPSTRLTHVPGNRDNYDFSGESFDDGLSMAQRFYGGAVAEHIYESPKFDRKSTEYDDISVDDGNDASAKFKLPQHPLGGLRLHSTAGQDGGSGIGGIDR